MGVHVGSSHSPYLFLLLMDDIRDRDLALQCMLFDCDIAQTGETLTDLESHLGVLSRPKSPVSCAVCIGRE